MGCISVMCNGCSNIPTCICCIFVLFIFFSPVIIPVTICYVGFEPRFYIHSLYVPAFNISTNNASSNPNNSIFIDLKFKRVVAYLPILYEDLNITLFYASNRSSTVAHHILPGFYQGKKKTVHRRAVVEARGLQPIPGGSTVALAVELVAKYKLKRCRDHGLDYEEPEAVVVAADVRLDASGNKATKKPVRLH